MAGQTGYKKTPTSQNFGHAWLNLFNLLLDYYIYKINIFILLMFLIIS